MRMAVPQRLVAVEMAVLALGHGVVPMIVVAVVMAVRMFMLDGLVLVLMLVRFAQMDKDAGQHQQPARQQAPAARSVA